MTTLMLKPSGDIAFPRYTPCLASNGEQQLAMWVAWLQWIAAQLMQDLVNFTLIVKPVSIQLWQQTESWREGAFFLWTAVGHCLLSCLPSSKGGFSPCVPKTWLSKASLLSVWGSVKRTNKKHEGYWFCSRCTFTIPLQMSGVDWERMRLDIPHVSQYVSSGLWAIQIEDNILSVPPFSYYLNTDNNVTLHFNHFRARKKYMSSQDLKKKKMARTYSKK